MPYIQAATLILALVITSSAKDSEKAKTVGEGVERAARLSQLTYPGSKPFHLKARIAELDSPDSDYKAEIEMYWEAPDRWRRIIKTPDFSQVLVVNGDKRSEQNQGDYFPWWLNDLLTAMLDVAPADMRQLKSPLPDLEAMQREFSKKLPPGLQGLRMDTGTHCVRSQESVGIPPVHNSIFTNICFQTPPGTVESIFSPDFKAEYSDFREFSGKRVARKISMQPEPGTKIEATITELSELKNPDTAMFAVTAASAPQEHIATLRVDESRARAALLPHADIAWQPVRDGKTRGSLSLLVYVDRQGNVRETWSLNSDNPFPADQARKEVANWKFKPMIVDGVPVQMETILTFAFETTIGNAIPVLSNEEARKLALHTVEPEFAGNKPPAGTTFKVRVAVDETGRVIGLKNIDKLGMDLMGPANVALHNWSFRPYLHNGKPDRFDADIEFKVQ